MRTSGVSPVQAVGRPVASLGKAKSSTQLKQEIHQLHQKIEEAKREALPTDKLDQMLAALEGQLSKSEAGMNESEELSEAGNAQSIAVNNFNPLDYAPDNSQNNPEMGSRLNVLA